MLKTLSEIFWLGGLKKGSRTNTVALAIAAPIWSLFGVMLVAAGSSSVWPQDWSRHRVAGLIMFALGLLMILQAAGTVINALRANRAAK